MMFEPGTYKVVAQFPMVLDSKHIFMYHSDVPFSEDDVKEYAKNIMHVPMMERKKGRLPDVRIDKVNIDIQAGDYVRYRHNEYHSVFIASNIEDGIVYNGEWDYYHDEPDGNPIIFCSKWTPEESELCWFWDTRDNLTVREFEEMYQSTFKPKGSVMGYKYCEPFLGERPTILRED